MFKPTLSDDYVHIYSGDPALDADHPTFDHEKWCEVGDEKYLPLKPGCEPVRFKLRHLHGRARAAAMDHVMAARNVGSGAVETVDVVALALVGIENGQMTDGSPFDVSFETDRRTRLRRVDDKTIDTLYSVDDGALIGELAMRVLRETTGNPT